MSELRSHIDRVQIVAHDRARRHPACNRLKPAPEKVEA
jgi:hypothetical protein